MKISGVVRGVAAQCVTGSIRECCFVWLCVGLTISQDCQHVSGVAVPDRRVPFGVFGVGGPVLGHGSILVGVVERAVSRCARAAVGQRLDAGYGAHDRRLVEADRVVNLGQVDQVGEQVIARFACCAQGLNSLAVLRYCGVGLDYGHRDGVSHSVHALRGEGCGDSHSCGDGEGRGQESGEDELGCGVHWSAFRSGC